MMDSDDLFMSDVHIGHRAINLNRRIECTNCDAYESSFIVKILTDRKYHNPNEFDEDGDLIVNRDITFLLKFDVLQPPCFPL